MGLQVRSGDPLKSAMRYTKPGSEEPVDKSPQDSLHTL
jgi:hypothetical protein